MALGIYKHFVHSNFLVDIPSYLFQKKIFL